MSHPCNLQVRFTGLAIRLADRLDFLTFGTRELIDQFDEPIGTWVGKNGKNGARDPQFQVCAEEADCDVQETLARSASATATRLLKKKNNIMAVLLFIQLV